MERRGTLISRSVGSRSLAVRDVHATRAFYRSFLASLSEPIREIVICSPYFGKLPKPFGDIVKFCELQRAKGVDQISVITRPPGGEPTAMSVGQAQRLSINDVDVFVKISPYLHSKLFHIEYRKGYFKSFVGSANFTLGGFSRNHEVVAEMEGVGNNSPCHREITRLLTGGTMSYRAWLEKCMPEGTGEQV